MLGVSLGVFCLSSSLGSSSSQTLANMLSVSPIGVPIVIANTFSMCWICRGNVQRGHLVY